MATNPPSGDGHRKGAVRDRSQVRNPRTDTWTKRDAETGRFMGGKKGGSPFKGVRKKSPPSPTREGSRLQSSNACPPSVMAGFGPAIHDLRVEGAPRGVSRAQRRLGR